MIQGEQDKKIGKIIAKAWADDAFKKKLLADPAATLKAEGVELSQGSEVRVLENTDKVFHLVIPPKPSSNELSDHQLDDASGDDGGGGAAVLRPQDMQGLMTTGTNRNATLHGAKILIVQMILMFSRLVC